MKKKKFPIYFSVHGKYLMIGKVFRYMVEIMVMNRDGLQVGSKTIIQKVQRL